MGIGSVARATGIPANTIRTWERRYGFPTPTRTEGKQRAYSPEVVAHLQLISAALKAGHRPRHVVALPLAELRGLVVGSEPQPAETHHGDVRQMVVALDGPALEGALRRALVRLGGVDFLAQVVSPLLHWLGDAWESGEIGVHHEHFASGHVRGVLDEAWRSLAPPVAASVVCATLPGEEHDLGVHMAAVAIAAGGLRPLVLPGSTPLTHIIAAQQATRSDTVVISLSAHADPVESVRAIRDLRAGLSDSVRIWLGGAGAPQKSMAGVTVGTDIAVLARLGALET